MDGRKRKPKTSCRVRKNSLKGIKFREKVAHNKITSPCFRVRKKTSCREKLFANQLIIARQNETIDYIFRMKTFSSFLFFLSQSGTKSLRCLIALVYLQRGELTGRQHKNRVQCCFSSFSLVFDQKHSTRFPDCWYFSPSSLISHIAWETC